MKKRDILDLIRYHMEKNEVGFRQKSVEIANEFEKMGDGELARYVMAQLTMTNTFSPQGMVNKNSLSDRFNPVSVDDLDSLPLPSSIKNDVIGIVNAASRNLGVHRFLFEGAPGTGKTETAKQIARLLNRDLFCVDFTTIVDSKLGQSQKNIKDIFQELNSLPQPQKIIVLFDEIDALTLDRTNTSDIREMGRVTSTMLKELDQVDNRLVIIATTNLYKHFDRALVRRFDKVVNFDRYSNDDLLEISEVLLLKILKQCPTIGRDIRLFKKIISLSKPIPTPGELKNLIRSALAFSEPNKAFDYLRRLLLSIKPDCNFDPIELKNLGLNLREIGLLIGLSKAQVSRILAKGELHE